MCHLTNFIQTLARLPENADIKITGKVDNRTRKGNYVTIKSGMVSYVYFVGKNVQNGKDIVEYVN